MTNPLNVTMLLVLITIAVGLVCASRSPDFLELRGRRMIARARAIRASNKCWIATYNASLAEDEARELERREMAALIGIEMRDGR